MEGNNVYNFTLEIDKEDRLDKHLKNHFPEYSRATIQKWIKNDNVKIDGKTCTQKDIIKSSCNVSIVITSTPEVNLIAEDIDLDVIHECSEYIVVNKPSGMVTHIAPGHLAGTLQNALYYRYPDLANVPRTGIIHRLDKDTSGVLVVARNLIAHNYLSAQLQEHKFEKTYHAIISRVLDKSITIEENIGRHPINRKKMAVTSNGKHAKSIVKPITNLVNSSHVEIKIITGRTHQIRVHMSFLNHPIIGDKLYGYRKNIFNKYPDLLKHIDPTFGQYLHAYSLSFRDNISGRMKSFNADYPAQYNSLLENMNEHLS